MRPAARGPSRSVPRPPTGEATTIPIIMEKKSVPDDAGRRSPEVLEERRQLEHQAIHGEVL